MATHDRIPHVRVAVIGSGFGGLGAAVRLRKEGVTDFVVLERADSVGGTWRDNDYPGCSCDVPSHLYSFSFAPNPDWPCTFAGQKHIRAYLERVTDAFGVRPHLRFGADLRDMAWDSERLRWDIETASGSFTADLVVSAAGPMSDPRIPLVPGLDSFPGVFFHTARWDHGYDLRDKRVAVIGTGASAVQIIPEIQPLARHLTVFQRTPAWVLPRADRAIGGVERWLHRHLAFTHRLRRLGLWGMRELMVRAFTHHPGRLGLFEKMSRRHLTTAINDPALRARLTPDYRIGCKRIVLSNTYYQALSRPNAEVVSSGLKEVCGSTLVAADGTRVEADVIIFGTGFHITDMPITDRIVGLDGRTLSETWKERGARALRGTSVAGFPNWLSIIGPNTGLGNSSMVLMIESQLNYLSDFLRRLDALDGPVALDARPEAVDSWNEWVQQRMARTVWNTGCTSWYLDANGRNTAAWPGTTAEFRRATRRVFLDEYEVLRPPVHIAVSAKPPEA
ncbi:NAD(P)/FAD-dependent oxidoreductase [Streptomyces sp. NPDC047072]|uniref:flavin-containing monooxygenase n=1 Tax=Streptomyces sp. NPDC047072 TaxID=3154809 RepID=UPI0033F772BD